MEIEHAQSKSTEPSEDGPDSAVTDSAQHRGTTSPANSGCLEGPDDPKSSVQETTVEAGVTEKCGEEQANSEACKRDDVPTLPLAPPSVTSEDQIMRIPHTNAAISTNPSLNDAKANTAPEGEDHESNSPSGTSGTAGEYCGPIAKPRAPKSSHYRGVSKTVRGKWQARLCVNSTQRNLGCSFKSPEEAARVWDAAAVLHFGDVVSPQMLNFPDEYRPNSIDYYQNFLVSAGALLGGPPHPQASSGKRPDDPDEKEAGDHEQSSQQQSHGSSNSPSQTRVGEDVRQDTQEHAASRMKYALYHDTRRHHGGSQSHGFGAIPDNRGLGSAFGRHTGGLSQHSSVHQGATSLIDMAHSVYVQPAGFPPVPVPMIAVPMQARLGNPAVGNDHGLVRISSGDRAGNQFRPPVPGLAPSGGYFWNVSAPLPAGTSSGGGVGAAKEQVVTVNRFSQQVPIHERQSVERAALIAVREQRASSQGGVEDGAFGDGLDRGDDDLDAEVGSLHWNEFQRAFRGKGVPMATLQQMYRCYKRGEEIPEMDKFQDVDLKRAEEDAAQDRLALAQDLYHFLTEGQEDGADDDMERLPGHFFRGQACFATNWNDFQKLFRGKGHTMNELQDMYRRYKKQLSREDASPVNATSPAPKEGGEPVEVGGKTGRGKGKKRKQREGDAVPGWSDGEQDRAESFYFSDGGEREVEEEEEGEQTLERSAVSKSELHVWNTFQSHYKGSGLSVAELQNRYRELKEKHHKEGKHGGKPSKTDFEVLAEPPTEAVAPDTDAVLYEAADSACSVCLGSVHTDLWVMCDQCEEWQHQLCAGYLRESEVPETHFCDDCLAARVAKGLPLPAPRGRADDNPPVDAEEVEDLCSDAEVKFSSRSLLYSTRQPHLVARKRLMAEDAAQFEARQIPVHLLIKQGSEEVLLGHLELDRQLTMGDVRMQVRELLLVLQFSQPQTSFCLYKVTTASFRDACRAQTDALKIAIWPTQDNNLARTVFRNPSDRVLVSLGKVVPAESLEAKSLQELTLQTIKPLVVGNSSEHASSAVLSGVIADDSFVQPPPPRCPVPKPLRPKVYVPGPSIRVPSPSIGIAGQNEDAEMTEAGAESESAMDTSGQNNAELPADKADETKRQESVSRQENSAQENTPSAGKGDDDVEEVPVVSQGFMAFKRRCVPKQHGSSALHSENAQDIHQPPMQDDDTEEDSDQEGDPVTMSDSDCSTESEVAADKPSRIRPPKQPFTTLHPLSTESDMAPLRAVLAGLSRSRADNPGQGLVVASRLADTSGQPRPVPPPLDSQEDEAVDVDVGADGVANASKTSGTPEASEEGQSVSVAEVTQDEDAAVPGEPGASQPAAETDLEQPTMAEQAAAEKARAELEQDKQIAAALAEGFIRRGGPTRSAAADAAAASKQLPPYVGSWTHVVECAGCHSLCGLMLSNIGEVCECPVCGMRFQTREHCPPSTHTGPHVYAGGTSPVGSAATASGGAQAGSSADRRGLGDLQSDVAGSTGTHGEQRATPQPVRC